MHSPKMCLNLWFGLAEIFMLIGGYLTTDAANIETICTVGWWRVGQDEKG
jgi:hypothetical protein